ncbi:DMT family transporter [Limibacillus sp. MBR-115]|uniref:DMT family transporter n=1 Tax=Limibacillus sp. MBR-115 TaxID=3156465 RepID=UPI0033948B34
MKPASPISPINRTMGALEWTLLIGLSLLWGGSFFFTGVAVRELPTFTIVVCRVFLAAVILLLAMRVAAQPLPREWRVWRAFLCMGFLNNAVPFSLIVWGQMHIASGVASIINATTPLFTVLLAQFLTQDERITPGRLLSVILGLGGVAAMIGGDALRSLGLDVTAQLACLAAAVSYALAGLYGRRFKALGVSPMATATGQLCASSVLLIPVMLLIDQPWSLPFPSLATIGALLGIASLSTALAYVIYFRILATAGATNLLLVTLLIPVSAILLGAAFLAETLLPQHLLGMGFIGLGLASIDGRLWRRFKSQFSG